MSRLGLFAFVLCVSSLAASSADAISSYRSRIPNGNLASCQTCHTNTLGGEGWNSFGEDVLLQDPQVLPADLDTSNQNANYAGQTPDWALDTFALCDADSDGDGQTNGQELGDPECVWTFTQPATPPPRTTDISRPGDSSSTSANPDGVDPAEGEGEEGEGEEGEGEEGEGEGGTEGEGETPPGCCNVGGSTAAPLLGLLAIIIPRRRR